MGICLADEVIVGNDLMFGKIPQRRSSTSHDLDFLKIVKLIYKQNTIFFNLNLIHNRHPTIPLDARECAAMLSCVLWSLGSRILRKKTERRDTSE